MSWKGDIKNIVYFIKIIDQDIYKIGHSRDLKSTRERISSIGVYCPFDIKLIGTSYFEDAILAEQKIQKDLKKFQLKGEWFRIPYTHINKMSKHINNRTPFFKKYLESIHLIPLIPLIPLYIKNILSCYYISMLGKPVV